MRDCSSSKIMLILYLPITDLEYQEKGKKISKIIRAVVQVSYFTS